MTMTDAGLNPFLLAANVPLPDPRLLPLLRAEPQRAAQQDSHGYSLLHAAASYNHTDLLRQLVGEFNVDINLTDEDGETCLFVTETVEVARCLVEELQLDTGIQNHEGQTAEEKIAEEGEYPDIAVYLRQKRPLGGSGDDRAPRDAPPAGVDHPPPLPPNMNISFNTVSEDQLSDTAAEQPDPDFRRRIEELAARENFHTDEGQQELRDLITDAVRGVSSDDREVRRRVD